MITRKHMERFADELFRLAAKEKADWERYHDAESYFPSMAMLDKCGKLIAKVIEEDNPRFDEQRFLVAAGCLNAYNQLEE